MNLQGEVGLEWSGKRRWG